MLVQGQPTCRIVYSLFTVSQVHTPLLPLELWQRAISGLDYAYDPEGIRNFIARQSFPALPRKAPHSRQPSHSRTATF